jgi:hypothetical protein
MWAQCFAQGGTRMKEAGLGRGDRYAERGRDVCVAVALEGEQGEDDALRLW